MRVTIDDGILYGIANAIRGKTGTSELISPIDMPKEITDIPSGGGDNLSDLITGKMTEYSNSDITLIKSPVFYASNLEKIVLPNLTDANFTLGYAFANCKKLKEFDAPKCVFTGDGSYSFAEDSSLERVNIGGFNRTAPAYMFSNCVKLNELPNLTGLTSLSQHMFDNTPALTIDVDLPQNAYIGQYAFNNSGITGVSGTAVDVASSSFRNCTNLVRVNLPDVQSCASNGFYGCTSLENISLPRCRFSSSSNAGYVFRGCSKLKKVDLGSSFQTSTSGTTYIGSYMFAECYRLEALIMRYGFMATLSASNAFPSMTSYPNWYVYVPSALYDRYASATNWSTLATAGRIRKIEEWSEVCG